MPEGNGIQRLYFKKKRSEYPGDKKTWNFMGMKKLPTILIIRLTAIMIITPIKHDFLAKFALSI